MCQWYVRPSKRTQHEWTTVYSLDLIIAQSKIWADISTSDTMWVFQSASYSWGSVEQINTTVGRKNYLAERRDKEWIGEVTDMECHLILPVKLQNWGFEDNSKQNPRHWFGNCFSIHLCSTFVAFQWMISQNYKCFLQTEFPVNWQQLV